MHFKRKQIEEIKQMEYDNNNREAVFPPRDIQKFILQGSGEINNKPIKVVMISDESKSGKKYIEVYEKIGVMFTNTYKEPEDNKPHYTGELEKYNKKIAGWKQNKDLYNYISFRITDPLEKETTIINPLEKETTSTIISNDGPTDFNYGSNVEEGESKGGW